MEAQPIQARHLREEFLQLQHFARRQLPLQLFDGCLIALAGKQDAVLPELDGSFVALQAG